MGLTIHYRLRSAASDAEQARDLLLRLRSRALDLPFESVENIVELTADRCRLENCGRDDPHTWLLIQTERSVTDPLEPARHFQVAPLHVIAFCCRPGPGCEDANFGLCRYPEFLDAGGRRIETRLRDWDWSSFCKTGYAMGRRYGGAGNFRRCHGAIIELLHYAQQLDILNAVYDEAGFWESRQAVADPATAAC